MIEVALFGDSITSNPYQHAATSYAVPLADVLGPGYHVVRYGAGGTIASTIRDFARGAASGKHRHHVVFFAGTNDINTGVAAATIELSFQFFLADMIAFGGNPYVWPCTILPSSQFSAPKNTELATYNAWLRSNYTSTVVDVNSALRDPTTPTQMLPAYLVGAAEPADVIHPGTAGGVVIAGLIAGRILSV